MDKVTKTRIALLHPQISDEVKSLIEQANKVISPNITIRVVQGLRTIEEQNDLYAQGRTKPGKKVTNAKAGQSFHNYKLAFDFVPIVNGKAQWNDLATFKRAGAIGERLGLDWAGRWISFKELAHLQWSGGLSLAQLRAGKKPVEPK